jgi:transcription elongation factor Elf1
MCPVCGHRTGTSVRTGDVRIFCRKCKAIIGVSIQAVSEQADDRRRAGGAG